MQVNRKVKVRSHKDADELVREWTFDVDVDEDTVRECALRWAVVAAQGRFRAAAKGTKQKAPVREADNMPDGTVVKLSDLFHRREPVDNVSKAKKLMAGMTAEERAAFIKLAQES